MNGDFESFQPSQGDDKNYADMEKLFAQQNSQPTVEAEALHFTKENRSTKSNKKPSKPIVNLTDSQYERIFDAAIKGHGDERSSSNGKREDFDNLEFVGDSCDSEPAAEASDNECPASPDYDGLYLGSDATTLVRNELSAIGCNDDSDSTASDIEEAENEEDYELLHSSEDENSFRSPQMITNQPRLEFVSPDNMMSPQLLNVNKLKNLTLPNLQTKKQHSHRSDKTKGHSSQNKLKHHDSRIASQKHSLPEKHKKSRGNNEDYSLAEKYMLKRKHVKDKDMSCVKLTKKEWMLRRKIDRSGTWVQCSSAYCHKWRYLEHVFDPSELPNIWTCSMNEDTSYNQCDIPEQNWGDATDHVFIKYAEGSVVWAKMDGYPWWPAMVETDPDYEYFCECRYSDDIVSHYHVVFFDEKISRSWVRFQNIAPFEQEPEDLKKSKCSLETRRLIDEARYRAKQSLELEQKERIKKYGFASRYHGKWGSEKNDRKKFPKSSSTKMQLSPRLFQQNSYETDSCSEQAFNSIINLSQSEKSQLSDKFKKKLKKKKQKKISLSQNVKRSPLKNIRKPTIPDAIKSKVAYFDKNLLDKGRPSDDKKMKGKSNNNAKNVSSTNTQVEKQTEAVSVKSKESASNTTSTAKEVVTDLIRSALPESEVKEIAEKMKLTSPLQPKKQPEKIIVGSGQKESNENSKKVDVKNNVGKEPCAKSKNLPQMKKKDKALAPKRTQPAGSEVKDSEPCKPSPPLTMAARKMKPVIQHENTKSASVHSSSNKNDTISLSLNKKPNPTNKFKAPTCFDPQKLKKSTPASYIVEDSPSQSTDSPVFDKPTTAKKRPLKNITNRKSKKNTHVVVAEINTDRSALSLKNENENQTNSKGAVEESDKENNAEISTDNNQNTSKVCTGRRSDEIIDGIIAELKDEKICADKFSIDEENSDTKMTDSHWETDENGSSNKVITEQIDTSSDTALTSTAALSQAECSDFEFD